MTNIEYDEESSDTLRVNSIELSQALMAYGKEYAEYNLPNSSNSFGIRINSYYSNQPSKTFVWLDSDFYVIEQRFNSLIYPNQWQKFSNVHNCQKFVKSQEIQYNKIFLITSSYLADELFNSENLSNIYAVYIYSNQQDILRRSIDNFSMIRGVYKTLESLFEQFQCDITTDSELIPIQHQRKVRKV